MATATELLQVVPAPAELRRGATGIIYKVNSLIVVKCPAIEGRTDFVRENRIFDILAQHPPCPELVSSFLRFDNGNFLEYMSGFFLSERLQRHQTRDPKSARVLLVQSLEQLLLRKTWMKALVEGIAWLESLGLAHGDLRPENVLVDDQDRVKIGDFDCTNSIGSEFEACILHMGGFLAAKLGQKKELLASLELVQNNSLLDPCSTTSTTELRFMMIKTLAKIMDQLLPSGYRE